MVRRQGQQDLDNSHGYDLDVGCASQLETSLAIGRAGVWGS
jgi:hypothetical protein